MDVAPSKRLPLLPTTASARFYCPRKCGKLNRTANVSIGGFQGGRARLYIARGTLFILVEQRRQPGTRSSKWSLTNLGAGCLYTLSSEGWICAPLISVAAAAAVPVVGVVMRQRRHQQAMTLAPALLPRIWHQQKWACTQHCATARCVCADRFGAFFSWLAHTHTYYGDPRVTAPVCVVVLEIGTRTSRHMIASESSYRRRANSFGK